MAFWNRKKNKGNVDNEAKQTPTKDEDEPIKFSDFRILQLKGTNELVVCILSKQSDGWTVATDIKTGDRYDYKFANVSSVGADMELRWPYSTKVFSFISKESVFKRLFGIDIAEVENKSYTKQELINLADKMNELYKDGYNEVIMASGQLDKPESCYKSLDLKNGEILAIKDLEIKVLEPFASMCGKLISPLDKRFEMVLYPSKEFRYNGYRDVLIKNNITNTLMCFDGYPDKCIVSEDGKYKKFTGTFFSETYYLDSKDIDRFSLQALQKAIDKSKASQPGEE